MAELFFEDERMGMQDPIYRNKISNTPFSDLRYQDMGGVHPPLGFPRNTSNLNYNIHQDPPENWRENIGINTLFQYPQPHLTNMRDISGEIGEYGRRPGEGFNEEMFYEAPNRGFNFPNFGLTGILQGLKDQFEYRPAETEAWDPNTGEYLSAEEQDELNALGGYYSDAARNARRQNQRVINMLARRAEGKSFSEKNLERLQKLGYGPEEIISQVTDVVQPGRGTTYTGPEARSFDPGIAARTQHPTERAGTRGGYTDPGRDSYGPWKAEGGRIGYRDGEFVDEDVNIQGPGFDVNENVMMASAVDPMDALNDMSMEIFGKPLHQLTGEEKQILFDMANDQAMKEQSEGIASLV